MRNTWLLAVFLLITPRSTAQEVKDFQWLVGTWKILGKNTNKDSYEVWKSAGDNTLTGISYNVKNADTLVTEEIKLLRKGRSVYYTPDVAGPQGEVEFKITSYDANSFVAENPTHDFPKKIRYHRLIKQGEERLEATIEGGGKSIYYTFVRVK
ncbi:hypothetical protein SAMN04488109_6498 [Chryseolinea serpens]|uniref:DUF6265 domain-containing protein n=1 Tax=Chryseolinea serpens TaxID=947013 RepID=A0A1M5XFS5_9BACT|nr:DUF6265 family protein [Chryseolinea serpens]SHH98626.1 hypothetical protein SAMN04488109_6498 [Chryseolinea serpens]